MPLDYTLALTTVLTSGSVSRKMRLQLQRRALAYLHMFSSGSGAGSSSSSSSSIALVCQTLQQFVAASQVAEDLGGSGSGVS